jgi:hypothetical protein
MFFMKEYQPNSHAGFYTIWIFIFIYYLSWPGAGSRSRNFTFRLQLRRPAKSSGSLRLHNTAPSATFIDNDTSPFLIKVSWYFFVPLICEQPISDTSVQSLYPTQLTWPWTHEGIVAIFLYVFSLFCYCGQLVQADAVVKTLINANPPMVAKFNSKTCSETTLTGESRFHISPPQGFWTQVPCDGKQRVSPLDQWDMVRMQWDCRLSTDTFNKWCFPLYSHFWRIYLRGIETLTVILLK